MFNDAKKVFNSAHRSKGEIGSNIYTFSSSFFYFFNLSTRFNSNISH